MISSQFTAKFTARRTRPSLNGLLSVSSPMNTRVPGPVSTRRPERPRMTGTCCGSTPAAMSISPATSAETRETLSGIVRKTIVPKFGFSPQ
jgi:hypothetical protein